MTDARPRKIFLHLGYRKTGTTTLQKHVFPKLEGLTYSARSELYGSTPETTVLTTLLNQCRYADKERKTLPDEGRDYLDRIKQEFEAALTSVSSAQPLLVSDENLLLPHPDGMTSLLDRFRHVVGPASVILVLRNPFDLFKSMYRQDLYNLLDIMRHDDPKDRAFLDGAKISNASRYFDLHVAGTGDRSEYFDYNTIVSAVEDRFGANNVLLLNFDTVKNSFNAYVEHLCAFMGVDLPDTFDGDSLPRENVAEGKLMPLLKELTDAGKITEEQAGKIEQWYDACDLTDAHRDSLAVIDERQCQDALVKCCAV